MVGSLAHLADVQLPLIESNHDESVHITLRSLIQESKDGEWGKGEPFEDSVEMAVIRGTDFGYVRIGVLDHLPRRHIPRRIAERKVLRAGDIVIETAGGSKDRPTGRTLLINQAHISKSDLPLTCASFSRFIRIDEAKADSRYMFWLLQFLYASNHMLQYHTQHTGVARFQWTTFAETEPLRLPSGQVQSEVADILSVYDDLIENNTRRIAILEEMARALYREWFVEFRFPGHEGVRMVESAAGPIPEGWEVRAIGEVVETYGGGTPSTKQPEFWDGGDIVWFSPTDLTSAGTMFIDNSAKYITTAGLRSSAARLFPAYSVMMTSRATIGVIAINTRPACTNQGFITCMPNERLSAYQIYYWLLENKEKIVSLASGATFKEINRTTFRKLPVVLPDRTTVAAYEALIDPVGKHIENLQRKNATLRQTRDLLLPKLVTGEIDVGSLPTTRGNEG